MNKDSLKQLKKNEIFRDLTKEKPEFVKGYRYAWDSNPHGYEQPCVPLDGAFISYVYGGDDDCIDGSYLKDPFYGGKKPFTYDFERGVFTFFKDFGFVKSFRFKNKRTELWFRPEEDVESMSNTISRYKCEK